MSRIADALSKTRHGRHVRNVAPLPHVPWDFTEGEDGQRTEQEPADTPVAQEALEAARAPEPPPVTVAAPAPTPIAGRARPIRSVAEVKAVTTADAGRGHTLPDAKPAVQRSGADERYAARLLGAPDLPAAIVEQYRALAATVVQSARNDGTRVLMVTSALPGEGKTLVASNLALTLSNSYRAKVLVIDADLRRPCIHSVFGLPGTPGVSDWISRNAPPSEAPLTAVSDNLAVMVAGTPRKDPMSIVSGPTMQQFVATCEEQYDWVIIDTPPVGLLADAGLLASLADKVLLVVHAGRTPYDAIQKATEALGPDRILGVVLNQVDDAASDSYHYQYTNYYSGTS